MNSRTRTIDITAPHYVALMAALNNVTKLIAHERWTEDRKGMIPAEGIVDVADACYSLLEEPLTALFLEHYEARVDAKAHELWYDRSADDYPYGACPSDDTE